MNARLPPRSVGASPPLAAVARRRDALLRRRQPRCRRTRRRRHLHRAGLPAWATPVPQRDTGRSAPAPGTANNAQQRRPAAPRPRQRDAATPEQRTSRDRRTTPSRAAPSRAPPPKPSEFQNFVEGATGRLLPIFGGVLRRRGRHLPVARQRAGLGRLHDRSGRRDRDARLGLDRRRLPQHGRPQRHAQPAQGRQLQRRRRQGVGSRDATCGRRSAGSTPTST